MNTTFAPLHVTMYFSDLSNKIIKISNIDFEKDVGYLKQRIADEMKLSTKIELVFDGIRALNNDLKLGAVMKPNGIVHCFQKTTQYESYKPTDKFKNPETIAHIQSLFTLIAHIQINVTSRVTIWQKILNEYPDFRRNLGAQAIIRDSVLFNTIHQSETINKIAENYPIICEAAQFIVDTIKKELARNVAANNSTGEAYSPSSPNSSEEDNSLGPGSNNTSPNGSGTSNVQTENSRIRAITRQQLQDALGALAQSGMSGNTNSVNSLSNIANTSTALSSSASGDRISAEMFRQQMQRAFNNVMLPTPTATTTNTAGTSNEDVQPMDTTEATTTAAATTSDANIDGNGLPASYRNHEYAEQLLTMSQMGFNNHENNLSFLNITNGNIENAINLLMAQDYE